MSIVRRKNVRLFAAIASCAFVFAAPAAPAAQEVPSSPATETAHAEARNALFSAASRFEYPEITARLENVVSADPHNAAARIDLAYAYSKRSRFGEAARHVVAAQVLRDQLSDTQSLWLDALAARVAGLPQEEIAAFRKLAETTPDDRWAWYELASSLSSQDRYAESADASARAAALESDPQNWGASWLYYLHSKALYRSGQYAAGIAAAEPGRATPETWRSTLYRQLLSQAAADPAADREQMMTEYRAFSVEEGRTPPAYLELNVALFYFELGDYARAAQIAREAQAMEDTAYGRWVLAYSLSEAEQIEEALDIIAPAAGKFPENQAVAAAHGWVLYRDGQLAAALDELLRARGLSARPSFRVEESIRIVTQAIEDGNDLPAPPIGWLG